MTITEQELGNYFAKQGIGGEQIQEFYPLPMTIAAACITQKKIYLPDKL